MENFPNIASINAILTIKINCNIGSALFNTEKNSPPSVIDFQIGIDAQPYDIPYTLTLAINCPSPIYSYLLKNDKATIMTMGKSTATDGNLQINNAT